MPHNPKEPAMSKYRSSKTEKVMRAIAKKAMTAEQIRNRFDIPNVSATIYDIRRLGFEVAVERVGRFVWYSL
jgi:hypothetical protein